MCGIDYDPAQRSEPFVSNMFTGGRSMANAVSKNMRCVMLDTGWDIQDVTAIASPAIIGSLLSMQSTYRAILPWGRHLEGFKDNW